MKLEETKCAICGRGGRALFSANDRMNGGKKFNVFKCDNCDLVYVNPRPTTEDIKSFYPEGYYKNEFLQQGGLVKKLVQWAVDREKRNFVLSVINKKDGANLLDIGCGDGRFLNSIRETGFIVYGTDISDEGLRNARKAYGLKNLFKGELKDARYEEGVFDAITLWTSLEHVHNPLDLLREVSRVLSKQGAIVLSVPNSASLQFRLFRERWFHLDVPRHLYIYSQKSMGMLCEKSGLRVLRVFNNNLQLNPAGWVGSIFGDKNKMINLIFPLLSAIFLPITLIEGLAFSGGSLTFVIKKL